MPGTFSSRVESGSDDHEPDDGSRRRWVAPVVTFVVGALLGGAAVGLVMRGQDAPAPVAWLPGDYFGDSFAGPAR